MKKILTSSVLAITLITTVGCAPRGFQAGTVGQNMTVEPGVVQSVKSVVINSQGVGNTLGGIVGTVAGAAAGNKVGGGTGKAVATVVGSVVGGVLGGTVGDKVDTNYGQQVVVRLNSGRTVATVLRVNESTPALGVGQAVNVFFSGGTISNISAR